MRFPPCSGETLNRKCLFASIFLNVNCERGELKRDGRSPWLSESHPQSYCSLVKNDAKHSLKPIYVVIPTREELSSQFWFRLCHYCVCMCSKKEKETCVARLVTCSDSTFALLLLLAHLISTEDIVKPNLLSLFLLFFLFFF